MSKGDETKRAVLEVAVEKAAIEGLHGLSIGQLASELGMSKSGLFAHFRSKSTLQTAVLQHASEAFVDEVVRPALRVPRGEARVLALFEHWLAWFEGRGASGCLFISATIELDDQPCEAREFLVGQQQDWLALIATIVKTAIDEGDFRADVDADQFAFEMYGLAYMLHLCKRLLHREGAVPRARTAFAGLVARSRS